MFNKKKKENLEAVKYFYKLLKSRIANDSILEYFMEQINYGKDHIVSYSGNEILIRQKNAPEYFHLIVRDDSISSEEVKWNGRSTVTKTVEFDNDVITVTSIEHNRITKEDTVCRFERIKKIETYESGILCHKRIIESSTSAEESSNYATDTETYIKKDRSAVERQISICEDDEDRHSTHIRYLKTNFYDVPPYDTSKQTHKVYMYGMGPATQEEYEEFKKDYEKSYTYKKA